MAPGQYYRPRNRGRRAAALTVVGLLALAGCSAQAGLPEALPDVRAVKLAHPVYEPTWSRSRGSLFALVHRQPRVARVDPVARGDPEFTMSAPLAEVGENIATSPTDQAAVFVPQPGLGRVVALDVPGLQPRDRLAVGHKPSYVDIDSGSKVLLALSEEGTEVTSVDLRDNTILPTQQVPAGPLSEVEGPKRGRLIEYHVVGPEGILLFEGAPGGVEQQAKLQLPVSASATDEIKASRIYVAAKGTRKLHAVDSHRGGHGLHVVATSRLRAPVKHLASDEVRIYAVTEHRLVVLETNSYEGFRDNEFQVIDRIDYRKTLPTQVKQTPLSGIAVGSERVYLTLDGEPYMVSVEKPDI